MLIKRIAQLLRRRPAVVRRSALQEMQDALKPEHERPIPPHRVGPAIPKRISR
jgi:hypothetical protein